MRESTWIFPTVEWIHLYSMIILISAIAMIDLELLGFSLSRKSGAISAVKNKVVGCVYVAFSLNLVTGSLLFAQKAPEYVKNEAFLTKVLFISIAVIYHTILLRRIDGRPVSQIVPNGATRLVGGISLLLWFGVIVASRWIAFM